MSELRKRVAKEGIDLHSLQSDVLALFQKWGAKLCRLLITYALGIASALCLFLAGIACLPGVTAETGVAGSPLALETGAE